MKKLLAGILTVSLLLSLAACGKKADNPEDETTTENPVTELSEETTEDTTAAPDGDIDDPEYWNGLYGLNICPFTVTKGSDSKTFYFRGGGSFKKWLFTENNKEGWYYYNDRVITKDGKWATDPDFDDAFSSCCEYVMKPYSGPTLSEEEQAKLKDGKLIAVHSWTPLNFESWNSLIFEGENYPVEEKDFEKETTLRLDYCDQEHINIYSNRHNDEEAALLKGHAKLYALPHSDIAGYKGRLSPENAEKAMAAADYICLSNPEADTSAEPIFKFFIANEYDGNPYFGKVDLIFTYDDVIAYYVTVTTHEAGWEMPAAE